MNTKEIMKLVDDYVQSCVDLECENLSHGTVDGTTINYCDEARAALEAALTEKHGAVAAAIVSSKCVICEQIDADLKPGTRLYERGVGEQEHDYWQQAYKMAQSLSDHLSVRPFSDPTPVNQQEPVAWTVAGKVTDWSRDFSAYKTKIYVRPVFVHPAPVNAQRITELEAELMEQARLNGMGMEREAKLMARVERLEAVVDVALEKVCGAKLCEVNSMSSRQEMLRLLEEAITKIKEVRNGNA